MTTDKQREEFIKLAKPLIKFLNDNFHPHTHIYIDCNSAELSEGCLAFTTEDYVRDRNLSYEIKEGFDSLAKSRKG